jgi:hypothetical protein
VLLRVGEQVRDAVLLMDVQLMAGVRILLGQLDLTMPALGGEEPQLRAGASLGGRGVVGLGEATASTSVACPLPRRAVAAWGPPVVALASMMLRRRSLAGA